MAGVCSTLGFSLVRRVLGALRLGPKPDDKDIEIAVLRHQLGIVQRQVPRPRYNNTDRVVLSTLARMLPRERWGAFLVAPACGCRKLGHACHQGVRDCAPMAFGTLCLGRRGF